MDPMKPKCFHLNYKFNYQVSTHRGITERQIPFHLPLQSIKLDIAFGLKVM